MSVDQTANARQHTLAGPVVIKGLGLHTGESVEIVIRPAAVDSGIQFVRVDVKDRDPGVRVAPAAVCQTRLGTVIRNSSGVTVATIEHLMAALAALNIDNASVELNGPEVPILDGSAAPFIVALDQVGRREQSAVRQFIEILHVVEVTEADGKRASLAPCPHFEVAFEIAFPTAVIGRQSIDLRLTEASFRRELADCRTFGFLEEVEALRLAGLARGGCLDNAIVIDGGRVLNPEGLRRPDEFVRHKALDAVGDLFVLGAPILGRFEGVLAGHGLNNALVRALMDTPTAWRKRSFAPREVELV